MPKSTPFHSARQPAGRVSRFETWARAFLLFILLFSAGCAPLLDSAFVKRQAAAALYPTGMDLVNLALASDDLVLVERTLESHMLLFETLIAGSGDDRDWLTLASRLYAYYAFGFVVDEDVERARSLYWKGIDYGMRVLCLNKGFREAMDAKVPPSEAVKHLNPDEDIPAACYTAMNMGMLLIASLEVPRVLMLGDQFKALSEWIIEQDETFLHGIAHTYLGVYYAILPSVIGGGPKMAAPEFEKAIRLDEDFLLHRFLYARYVPTLTLDEEQFDQLVGQILEAKPGKDPSLNALNNVAKKKARLLLEERRLYF